MTPGNSFHQPLCANCQKPGGSACASCRLVTVCSQRLFSLKSNRANTYPQQYCSKACQTGHWKTHKHDCKSPLGRKAWIPAWAVGGERKPSSFDKDGKRLGFNRKYLFGNMPALDVLNLKDNEGSNFCGDLKVLLAGKCQSYR